MKKIEYRTRGTCSREIHVTLDDEDRIVSCSFIGGCAGITAGLSKLVEGMPAREVIARLKGIPCGLRGTSCPDQLAAALEKNL